MADDVVITITRQAPPGREPRLGVLLESPAFVDDVDDVEDLDEALAWATGRLERAGDPFEAATA